MTQREMSSRQPEKRTVIDVGLPGQQEHEDFAKRVQVGAGPRFDALELFVRRVPERTILSEGLLGHQGARGCWRCGSPRASSDRLGKGRFPASVAVNDAVFVQFAQGSGSATGILATVISPHGISLHAAENSSPLAYR